MKIQVIIGILIVVSLSGCNGNLTSNLADKGLHKMAEINPTELLPDRCLLPVLFDCKSFKVWDDSILIDIQNNAGQDVNILSLQFESENQSCFKTFNQELMKNNETELLVDGCNFTVPKYGVLKIDVNLKWKYLGSTFSHDARGELLTHKH
jgi:hypothetical protein